MVTIWGRLSAFNVLKVLWAADETGVAYNRLDAGRAFGVVDESAYRQLNPNGLVPTIDDDGFVLWESNAIIRYLCARYGRDDIYPADIKRRADAERWMDWQALQMFPAYRASLNFYGRGLTDLVSEEEADASFRAASALFAILDERLSRDAFVAGDAFSIGDIPIGVIANQWFQLSRQAPGLTHVRRWRDRLAKRPGARQTFSVPITLAPNQTFAG